MGRELKPRNYKCRVAVRPNAPAPEISEPECWLYRNEKSADVYMSVLVDDGNTRQRLTLTVRIPHPTR